MSHPYWEPLSVCKINPLGGSRFSTARANALKFGQQIAWPIAYWRTVAGQETDFILGDAEIAIEVNSSPSIDAGDLKNLMLFVDEYRPKAAFVITNEKNPRTIGPVKLLPWRDFLSRLWDGAVIG